MVFDMQGIIPYFNRDAARGSAPAKGSDEELAAEYKRYLAWLEGQKPVEKGQQAK